MNIRIFVIIVVLIPPATAQAGKKFILGFPPESNLRTDGSCKLILHANTRSKVSLLFYDNTHEITVEDEPYTFNMNCTIRAPPGHSSNAVIVKSDVDITVQVYLAVGTYGFGDAYLATPSKNVGAEYVIFTPPKPCTHRNISSVFTIAAELDNTQVMVYAPASGGYSLIDTVNLNKYGTYTNGSASSSVDYTGWKVVSPAPIAVVSGSSCFQVTIGSSSWVNAGYVFSPSLDQIGEQFIVPKITKETPGNSGAYIRVISFSQSNTVDLPDQSIHEVIHTGQFFQYHISTWDEITRIDCLEPCAVYLFNEVKTDVSEGGFNMYITPIKDFKDNAQFTVISGYKSYITVISHTNNIKLDGTTLHGWRQGPEWNYYEVAVEVNDGGHTLQSSNGGKFAAYVYGHGNHGYGFEIVREDLTATPTTTTVILTTVTASASAATTPSTMDNSAIFIGVIVGLVVFVIVLSVLLTIGFYKQRHVSTPSPKSDNRNENVDYEDTSTGNGPAAVTASAAYEDVENDLQVYYNVGAPSTQYESIDQIARNQRSEPGIYTSLKN